MVNVKQSIRDKHSVVQIHNDDDTMCLARGLAVGIAYAQKEAARQINDAEHEAAKNWYKKVRRSLFSDKRNTHIKKHWLNTTTALPVCLLTKCVP